MKKNLSSFTVLTIFICLSIIGASLIPLLSVQLTPTRTNNSLSVHFAWQDASSKVIEQEVTSKLEGVFNTVHGISSISSSSQKGSGSISMNFKKGVDMDARVWGLMPEKPIVGKVQYVIFSNYQDKFQWNRLFESVD